MVFIHYVEKVLLLHVINTSRNDQVKKLIELFFTQLRFLIVAQTCPKFLQVYVLCFHEKPYI